MSKLTYSNCWRTPKGKGTNILLLQGGLRMAKHLHRYSGDYVSAAGWGVSYNWAFHHV